MIERAKPPALTEPWRFIVATRSQGADQWDVALFAEEPLAQQYYRDVALSDPNVVEGCLARVVIHHTRP